MHLARKIGDKSDEESVRRPSGVELVRGVFGQLPKIGAIVSNDMFNRHTGMAIACPITNMDRHYPFHVAVRDDLPATGFVMVDQVESMDFRTRFAKRIGKTPDALPNEVLAVLDACVY